MGAKYKYILVELFTDVNFHKYVNSFYFTIWKGFSPVLRTWKNFRRGGGGHSWEWYSSVWESVTSVLSAVTSGDNLMLPMSYPITGLIPLKLKNTFFLLGLMEMIFTKLYKKMRMCRKGLSNLYLFNGDFSVGLR